MIWIAQQENKSSLYLYELHFFRICLDPDIAACYSVSCVILLFEATLRSFSLPV